MSVQTEIDRIASAKTAIGTAIAGKGVTVPSGTMLDGMAALIEDIEQGSDPVLQSKTVSPTTSAQTVTPDSGYDGLSKVTVNAMPTATQATPSISVSSAGLITASATQTAGYVAAGTKSATKQLTVQAAQTITPGTADQTIASGRYLTGDQTIKGDANLTAPNIAEGVSIFGVTGTHSGGEDVSAETAEYTGLLDDLETAIDALPDSGGGSGSSFPNGTEWTQSNITSLKVYDVYYGNGMWVAGCYAGAYYSTDGKTWTRGTGISYSVNTVRYAEGMWVCGANTNGGWYYSTDGMTWTQGYATQAMYGLSHANGLWVGGSARMGILYSTTGTSWTQSNVTNRIVYEFENACGLWVAASGVGGIYYSADGMTWTQTNITSGNFCTDAFFQVVHIYPKGSI